MKIIKITISAILAIGLIIFLYRTGNYDFIINPIIVNTTPRVLKLLAGIASINLDIFLIFDGNKAQSRPSINKTKPMAIMNSFKP